MDEVKIVLPEDLEELKGLTAGTAILLTGTVFTARDQAHLRLTRALASGAAVPVSLEGQVIFYAGPAPAPPVPFPPHR